MTTCLFGSGNLKSELPIGDQFDMLDSFGGDMVGMTNFDMTALESTPALDQVRDDLANRLAF